jgi:hypothetical protein
MAKVFDLVFLCEAVVTRNNLLVMIPQPKSAAARKKVSPYAKLGRVSGHTMRGWLRHAAEKILIEHGVSVCHPLSRMSVTNKRNIDYYKKDLALGYHERGACKEEGGCLIYNLFGDLDKLGNLMVQSVYFFPTTSGNGSATKNINKFFNSVGGGRLEVINSSPRARAETHQTYMAIEDIAGVMIEAPFHLILHEEHHDQEILLLKTLEFLKTEMRQWNIDHMLGGMRNSGYGRAVVLELEPGRSRTGKKKQEASGKKETSEKDEKLDEAASEEEATTGTVKIKFELRKSELAKLESEFSELVERERAKFPLDGN